LPRTILPGFLSSTYRATGSAEVGSSLTWRKATLRRSAAFALLSIRVSDILVGALREQILVNSKLGCRKIECACEQHRRIWVVGIGTLDDLQHHFARKCLTSFVHVYLVIEVGRISVPLPFGRLAALTIRIHILKREEWVREAIVVIPKLYPGTVTDIPRQNWRDVLVECEAIAGPSRDHPIQNVSSIVGRYDSP